MSWATLQIVEISSDLTTTKNGNVLINMDNIEDLTKHRDANGNEYTCLYYKSGRIRLVQEHPITIRSMVASVTADEKVSDFKSMDRQAPVAYVAPKKKAEVKTEFPDTAEFKTQTGHKI